MAILRVQLQGLERIECCKSHFFWHISVEEPKQMPEGSGSHDPFLSGTPDLANSSNSTTDSSY
jgi:hypothetical protein